MKPLSPEYKRKINGTDVVKDEIKKFLEQAIKNGFRVFGPVKDKNGLALSEITRSGDITFDYGNFTLPPKRHFFPWSELVFTAVTIDGDVTIQQAPFPGEKIMIFGVRPCDTRSFSFLDSVFIDDKAPDPYYKSRRDNSVIISLACNEPLPTCFCTSVGGSPVGKDGTDILVVDIGDSLLFDACSEKGTSFLDTCTTLFFGPGNKDLKAAEDQGERVKKKMKTLNISGAPGKLKGKFYDPVWDNIALRCLGCGVCTYSCPTCYCFGLYDEKSGEVSTRKRIHDACMYPSFTLEASGHNPRTTQNERMRQRLMHKFSYTVENFGEIFCAGCGRCITGCPVNIDIRESIAEVIG